MSALKSGYPSIDQPWTKQYKQTDFTGGIRIPQCSYYESMKKDASAFSDCTALEYLGRKITYRQFLSQIDTTARALMSVGVKPGQIVSVCLPNMPEVIFLFYAINKIGAVANMLDPRCAEKWLKESVVEAASKVLICLDTVAPKFQSFLPETQVQSAIAVSAVESFPAPVRKVLTALKPDLRAALPSSWIRWNHFIKEGRQFHGNTDAPFIPDSNAVIAYTGGTTGDPKGVVGTNETINANYQSQLAFGYDLDSTDRILAVAPPWTYYGLCNSVNNFLHVGACIVLIPKTGPDELGFLISKYKPTFIISVPSALNALFSDPLLTHADLSFIKTLIVGADKLDETMEKKVNDFLHSHGCQTFVMKGYGMTEVMASVAVSRPDGTIGSVGIPTPGNIVSAFTEKDGMIVECRTGETGELAILTPSLMKTYFGKSREQNGDIIRVHPDGRKWAHTGDLGYIDEDGRIHIAGRIKRMFVRNGYKVFSASIEKCILRNPLVSQAAVVSVSDQTMGNITKAVLVLKQGADAAKVENEIRLLVRQDLYDYEWPDQYEYRDSLPLTPMGKIDYRALEEA